MPTSELRVEKLHSSERDVLRLSESLDEKALKTLVLTTTLGTRFPKECEAWNNRWIEIEKRFQKLRAIAQRKAAIHVDEEAGALESAVREAVLNEILKAFPSALTVHLRQSSSTLTFSFASYLLERCVVMDSPRGQIPARRSLRFRSAREIRTVSPIILHQARF